MPEIKIETTLTVPEGFEYTGEYRKARKGDFIYEQRNFCREWTLDAESAHSYHIFRKKPPTHGKILDSVIPLSIFGYDITAYDVYGVQCFAELEKLIPVGYEAVRFGIPRKGDDYLCVIDRKVECCKLGYTIRPRLILRKVTT